VCFRSISTRKQRRTLNRWTPAYAGVITQSTAAPHRRHSDTEHRDRFPRKTCPELAKGRESRMDRILVRQASLRSVAVRTHFLLQARHGFLHAFCLLGVLCRGKLVEITLVGLECFLLESHLLVHFAQA